MMKHNNNEFDKTLNIITTDDRTFNNFGSGVIPGSSLNIPVDNLDNESIDSFTSPYKIPSSYEENCVKKYFIKDVTYSPYNEHFKFYINADNTQKNSGCGFIFHSSLQCYLHHIETITGRLMHLTFIFKKHSKYHSNNILHLIGIYAPQKIDKMINISNKIFTYISQFINKTPFDQNHVILGDFNVDYNKFDKRQINSRDPNKIPWHDKLLYHLYTHNYIDCALKIKNEKVKPTFYSSADINSHSSRIDYIFCNHYTSNYFIHYSNIFTDHLSDHSLIHVTLKNYLIITHKRTKIEKDKTLIALTIQQSRMNNGILLKIPLKTSRLKS